MEQYSIKQTAELLQISKDTLRYYDKLTLISPKRSENRYRYYSDEDILDLQLIEVLKYANFTLAEIRQFLKFKRGYDKENDSSGINRLFEDKKEEFQQKIKTYTTLIALIDKTLNLKKNMLTSDSKSEIHALVSNLFNKLRSDKLEE